MMAQIALTGQIIVVSTQLTQHVIPNCFLLLIKMARDASGIYLARREPALII